jgi:hypothetical protein
MSKRIKRMALVGVVLLAGFMVFMAAGGFADVSPPAVSVSAGVTTSLAFSFSSGVPVDFGSGLAPGSTTTKNAVASVSSNKPWAVSVTKTGDLSTLGPPPYTMPITALTFTATGGPEVQNPATDAQFGAGSTTVCSGCDRGGGIALNIAYKLVVPWTAPEGTYGTSHTYTASQP